MEKQSKVKHRRKLISPVFHLQSKEDDDKYLTKDMIKSVRRTGQLNLSGKHLSSVPAKIFTMYDLTDENAVNVDFNRVAKEDELWWNLKPLMNLDLSSNVLTEVPGQISIFQDLTIFNLQDNSLTTLPKEITNLTKLTRLILNRNKLNILPEEISNIIDLRILLLNYNCLEFLPDGVVDLVMLEKLELSNNCLKTLPTGIGFLVRLMELNVSYNKLSELPPDIVNLRSLQRLDISHNNIQHLPESFCELRKLQILHAQHNNIEEIPDLTGCECIQEIYFGNNYIKEIPLELCENLIHLKILELRDNQIKTLPREIAKLMHIAKIDLVNNELAELPPSLALLPHLQTLKVEGNKLKQIRVDVINAGTTRILQHLREKLTEDEIESLSGSFVKVPSNACVFPDRYKMKNGNILNLTMKNLSDVPDEVFLEAKEARVTIVDLCKNKFNKIPCGLQKITPYLSELNLSNNQIKEVPEYFSSLTTLKFLDLSNNQLSSLPSNLSELVSLRELVLFNNRFTKIPECVYPMAGLEILMFNDNSLDEINIDGLTKLTRLAVLNLSNNNINYVPPQLGNMKQIKSLELKGNPFRQPRYAILEQGTEAILSYLRDKIPTP
ncbi:leucine-rich repeat-containing protein 40-like [Cylas formicarius]|uniref:leucine-rich repeat-containing protein 40-like n=1 Tax=Cylas formicarius TaxID=197179 RepID=UPI002958322A|nr:leucine-rich repeat-containing protein 40-like [Cylas formicarius]